MGSVVRGVAFCRLGCGAELGFSRSPESISVPKSSWLRFKISVICVISLFIKMVPVKYSWSYDRRQCFSKENNQLLMS